MPKALLLLVIACFYSCAPAKVYPLRDKYLDGPFTVTTVKSFDKAWDATVDFFTQLGIPIRVVEKASGLIVSERMDLYSQANYEDIKTGQIKNSKAWIGVETRKEGRAHVKPTRISRDWNVRLKESNGQTVVAINLVNIKAVRIYEGYEAGSFKAKSTGVFEKSVADWITRPE